MNKFNLVLFAAFLFIGTAIKAQSVDTLPAKALPFVDSLFKITKNSLELNVVDSLKNKDSLSRVTIHQMMRDGLPWTTADSFALIRRPYQFNHLAALHDSMLSKYPMIS